MGEAAREQLNIGRAPSKSAKLTSMQATATKALRVQVAKIACYYEKGVTIAYGYLFMM